MKKIRFAVIGDSHYSKVGNYATRDCLGAKKQLKKIINILNEYALDFVLSLGDIGNGDEISEIQEMLEVYALSVNPVKFVVGNHDLVLHTDEEYAKLVGMPAPFYDYDIHNYKFIVLNAFEQSRYSPDGSVERENYNKFISEHDWLKVQSWPGLMTEDSWHKLESLLTESLKKQKNTIIFSHVPTVGFGGKNPARIPEHIRMLELLDKYPNVRAYIAGHCHRGGLSIRKGVMHKTMRSVCDHSEPTACVFEVDETAINVKGLGNETDFKHNFDIKSTTICGTAPEGTYVMTNCGDIVRVEKDGTFMIKVPCPGMYAIKAVKDGCDDCYIPMVEAPATGLAVNFRLNPMRKLYTDVIDGYNTLHITDDGKPIHWFDVSGQSYGSVVLDMGIWHEKCNNYWTNGVYAFTAEGKVDIRVLPKHKQLRDIGWYKGDLHAHLIHGENIYIGNIQESAFIGKSEGYDWLYMARHHGNDGYPTDVYSMVYKLSDKNFLYRINEEFPKSRSNHFGNCCVEPVGETVDTTKISSLELAQRYIWDRGGVTIPVHPFYEHMCFREICLWILCAPDKMPCIDFFYNDDFPKHLAEKYWFMLLNRGYEIGCFATSDAAFDVGRTPGTGRGSTYLYMRALSEPNIKQAILEKRTMVSWDCAAIVFSIDDFICGDRIAADGTNRWLSVKLLWQKDRRGTLRIIRCGEDILCIPVEFYEDEQELCFGMNICEQDNSWYACILEDDGIIRSVASPIYFRNDSFSSPKVLKLKKPIPQDILAECENLNYEDLARPELIDDFEQKLIQMGIADY